MLIVLGLFGPGPNPSAALLIDGQIIAWAEEERFNRIKTAPNSLPIKSTKWCLEYAGITLDQVDKIAYGWDCPNYITNTKDFFISQREIFSDSSIYNQLQEELYLNIYHPDRIKYQLQLGLGSLSIEHKLPEIVCEPGRALVAESGSTIVKVNLRKKQKLYINDGTYGT